MQEPNPLFTKGHLRITLEKEVLEFLYQMVSVYGVSSLPSNSITQPYFGKTVFVNVEIPAALPLHFKTRAKVLREKTINTENMSLKFELNEEQRTLLSKHIEKHGFYPTEYVRKYPRIPAAMEIQTFPLKALFAPLPPMRELTQSQLVSDVINLSPNGALLATDSELAQQLNPGQRIKLELEARGWFPISVHVEGLICRVRDELNSQSGNVTRHFGVKFIKVDRVNKTAFLDLLKDILDHVKVRP